MAIAQSILDIALGEMDRRAATRLIGIKVSIGEFSGVVKEALEFAFQVLTPDTRASDAAIDIDIVPLTAECPRCGPSDCRLNDLNFLCTACGAALILTGGREMKVEYVDLD
ncbi:MAG: hydrogenase maturation nickel metallochaperone HypA [Acidobacteria bacterium]|nr:hydrogenase maturation nickel metallochaperone HypA [Acidobacteriota bacterium]